MSKTKYRLKAEYSICGDMSLQFLHNNIWYYVPESDKCYVLGYCLSKDKCDVDGCDSINNMVAFKDQESYDLIPFTKQYIDIDVYFENMRRRRVSFLEDKNKKRRQLEDFMSSKEYLDREKEILEMKDVYL